MVIILNRLIVAIYAQISATKSRINNYSAGVTEPITRMRRRLDTQFANLAEALNIGKREGSR